MVVSGTDIDIKQKVYFELGNAEIKAESHWLLGTVAAALTQHERLRKVAIEGHTDDLGVADDNQGLSQRRAEAVVKFLTDKGIAAVRLVAEGHGRVPPPSPFFALPTQAVPQPGTELEFEVLGPGADHL